MWYQIISWSNWKVNIWFQDNHWRPQNWRVDIKKSNKRIKIRSQSVRWENVVNQIIEWSSLKSCLSILEFKNLKWKRVNKNDKWKKSSSLIEIGFKKSN